MQPRHVESFQPSIIIVEIIEGYLIYFSSYYYYWASMDYTTFLGRASIGSIWFILGKGTARPVLAHYPCKKRLTQRHFNP